MSKGSKKQRQADLKKRREEKAKKEADLKKNDSWGEKQTEKFHNSLEFQLVVQAKQLLKGCDFISQMSPSNFRVQHPRSKKTLDIGYSVENDGFLYIPGGQDVQKVSIDDENFSTSLLSAIENAYWRFGKLDTGFGYRQ